MSNEMTKEISYTAAVEETTQHVFPSAAEMLVYHSNSSGSLPFFTSSFEKELMQRTLDIPEVLEEIMKKLDTESLLSCRRVKSNWNHEAKKILEKTVKVREIVNLAKLQEFSETIKTCIAGTSLHFRHLRFYADKIPSTCRQYETPLNFVRHHVTALELSSMDKMPSLNEINQLIYNFFPNLEKVTIEFNGTPEYMQGLPEFIPYCGKTLLKLEHIVIHVRSAVPGRHLQRLNCFYKTLIGSAANLKWLALSNVDTKEGAIMEDVLSSITSRKIQRIEMDEFWTSVGNVTAFSNHNFVFPLTTLQLAVNIGKVDLKPLLERYSSTLVELVLEFPVHEFHANVNIPFGVSLRNLSSLELNDFTGRICIDWSRVPKLKTLTLFGNPINEIVTSMVASPNNAANLDTLNIIIWFNNLYERRHPIGQMLSHLNSQLTSLEVCCFDLQLAVVFKSCKNLKSLKLEVVDPRDSELCGFEESQELTVSWPEDRIQEKENLDFAYRNLVTQSKNSDFPSRRVFPHIGFLKELQILELAGNFTEISLLYGIIDCGNLRRMKLRFSFINRIERSSRIIRQAGLAHLTCAVVNDELINHLP